MGQDHEFDWIIATKKELDNAVNWDDIKAISSIFQQCYLTTESELIELGLNSDAIDNLFQVFEAQIKTDKLKNLSEESVKCTVKIRLSYFLLDLLAFINSSKEITAMVVSAAFKRKGKGIPALREQNVSEQINHMTDHLDLWRKGEPGDEDTVEDQAKHTVCRSLLAYFTYKIDEIKL